MTPSGRHVPPFPTDDLAVPAPPSIPRPRRGMLVMPIVGVGAMFGTIALMWTSGLAGARNPLAMMLPVTAIASAIGMLMQSGAARGLAELDSQRVRFVEHLGNLGERLCEAAKLQSAALNWIHPPPSALWTLVGGPRMWERRPTDADFLHARVGVGDQRLCRRLALPALATAESLDQVSLEELRRFARVYSAIADAPIAVAMLGAPAVSIAGDPAGSRGLARAIICQLAVLHSPDHVSIDVRADGEQMDQWDWIKWLPHNAFRSSPGRRHSILVVDRDGEIRLVSGADDPPEHVGYLPLRVTGQNLVLDSEADNEIFGRSDGMGLAEAKACARRLSGSVRARSPIGALEMWRSELNLDDLADIDPELLWGKLGEHQRLCVPLGATADGTLLSLNIREASEDGIGPHGLCVGATGSGKSELLRTLVLGMIARHSPDELNLVLVDFKGGATFLDLSGMHHVAAVITNLSDEAYLVGRMKDALTGEMHRRQQQLRRAGNVADVAAYRALRRTNPVLPPMPTLLIVVDEFAELLTQHPDFIEVFSSIGRLGRSLGMHMLLASQRLDESRLRGLESHLSYRICLKTLTSADSRSVLGVTDAADLPATPGAAILRSADGTLTHFRAVRVTTTAQSAVPARGGAISRFTLDRGQTPVEDRNRDPGATIMDTVLGELRGRGSPAHQIWLPPLQSEPELDGLIRGMAPPSAANLAAPVGVIDLPVEQRRAPLIVDAGGAGGNVAVVGAPQTGKSTAVMTLITSFSSRHDSSRIQFYCIDFGGGALSDLASLPHVGSVAARSDRELIRRTVAHVESLLGSRGASTGRNGDLFLVIDGWAAFREECEDLEPVVTRIAAQGLSVGVHIILTAARWADIRPGLKDQIGTRLELRLADPVESEVDRRQAAMVPQRLSGRGIIDGGDHFVVARPDFDLIDHGQEKAPPVPMLPEVVEIVGFPRRRLDAGDVYLGLGERKLEPLTLDFVRHSHLLILGDGDCGKTSALRLLCRQLTQADPPDKTKLFVVDYRRTLLGVVAPDHLIAYAFSNYALAEQLPALVELLEKRIPGADVTAEQLLDGSWWAGSRVFVIVDDFDLVSDVGDSLRPLVRLLPYAGDIGLHFVVARRSAGASRAMFEPLLSQMRDTGCPVLLMNGSPEEGSLIRGRRPAPQPVGRGMLIDGDDAQAVQVGWCPP